MIIEHLSIYSKNIYLNIMKIINGNTFWSCRDKFTLIGLKVDSDGFHEVGDVTYAGHEISGYPVVRDNQISRRTTRFSKLVVRIDNQHIWGRLRML